MANLNTKNKKDVIQVQLALGVKADGIWGPKTIAALIKFQQYNYLVADGICGPKTMEALGILDTDLSMRSIGVAYERFYLNEKEYISSKTPIKNEYLFLHHTAGWNNPFDVVSQWEKDSLGRIATEFVIGGKNAKTGDANYDGRIVKVFPDGCQAYHLGNTKSKYMNEHSVGIEMCNFGYLTESNKTYTGVVVPSDQVTVLKDPFRGYTHWHSYSHDQLIALRKLILFIANRDNIEIHDGLIERINNDYKTAFDYDEKCAKGEVKGLLSHGNVRKDKFDIFPQPELIDMLLTL